MDGDGIDIVALITPIATLIAALATLWTVIEIKKQRETTYFPDLYVGEISTFLYGKDFSKELSFFMYAPIQENDIRKEGEKKISFYTKLYNVGFAVAKDVSLTWMFDTDNAIKILKNIKVDKEILLDDKIENRTFRIQITNYKSNNFLWLSDDLMNSRVSHILPSTFNKNFENIILPQGYLDFLNFIIVFKYKTYEKEVIRHKVIYENFQEMPPLNLLIKYKDLKRKNHERKFELRFNFIGYHDELKPLFGEVKLGYFMFHSKEL
jgi:hypothetical protein